MTIRLGDRGMQWFMRATGFDSKRGRDGYVVSVRGQVDGSAIRAYATGKDAQAFQDAVLAATPEGMSPSGVGHMVSVTGTLRRSQAGHDYIEAAALVLLTGPALELHNLRESAAELLRSLSRDGLDPRVAEFLQRVAPASSSLNYEDGLESAPVLDEAPSPVVSASGPGEPAPDEVEAVSGSLAVEPESHVKVVAEASGTVEEHASEEPAVVESPAPETPADPSVKALLDAAETSTVEQEPASPATAVGAAGEPGHELSPETAQPGGSPVDEAASPLVADDVEFLSPVDAGEDVNLDEVDVDALVEEQVAASSDAVAPPGEAASKVAQEPVPEAVSTPSRASDSAPDLEPLTRFGVRPNAWRGGNSPIGDFDAKPDASPLPAKAAVPEAVPEPVLAAMGKALPAVAPAARPLPPFMRKKG